MKTIDNYKGDPFYNRDIAFLAEDPNYNKRFVARAIRAEDKAFKSGMEAYRAEGELDRIHNEVRDALSKGDFRGVPLRDKDFDYPIVDPIKWANITLKRYTAKEIPEHHGAEMYRMNVLIASHELEMLSGEQIKGRVKHQFMSQFAAYLEKALEGVGR